MRRVALCLILVALLSTSAPAPAELCTIDAVPAATLLLPYFEVDPNGAFTTLFSINNAFSRPALAHVTFWTDLSVPTLDFDVYLTGFDVVTMSLTDVFNFGLIPSTSVVNIPEDENPNVIPPSLISPAPPGAVTPCPWEASRTHTANFTPFAFGWLHLNLNTITGGPFGQAAQAYVSQIHQAAGLFSAGYPGIQLDSGCNPNQGML